ncbi:hypothetical protein AYO38_09235 [bacterium SCGC AG-212-C10]|nr:hypothetical protein AYO38_09235 [bacterium SCGC AG-212-C10]
MNTQKQIFLIVVLMFAFTASCAAYAAIDLPVRADVQDDYQYDGRVERGALLFANNCRTCHGIKGEGFVGPALNGTIREEGGLSNFQDQSPLILAANQALIRKTLQCGRAGTLMPAWLKDNGGSLSRIQIEHLVELLTAPADRKDAEDLATSKGWEEAEEFAHNLNHEASAVVGGDTLSNIAKAHGVGPQALYDFNTTNGNSLEFQKGETPGLSALIKRGSTVLLPPNATESKAHEYLIRQDNETIAKIADSQNIGAIIIADLNKMTYKVDHKRQTFDLLNDGNVVPGMFPGITLALPEGATYTVVAGNTLDSIATAHGLQANAILSLNSAILPANVKTSDPLDAEKKLTLPNGTGVVVQTGETLAAIASAHGISLADFAADNSLAVDATVTAGQTLKLPDGTKYTVQTGDTLSGIAAHHAIALQALSTANNNLAITTPDEPLSANVVIKLPKVDKYVVQGQTLDEVAKGFGNVTAKSLADTNGVADPASLLRIGQNLKLPPETYGSAPPDAKNPGTACVEHAVPDSVFNGGIPGVGSSTPEVVPTAPASTSRDVKVDAHANDWTVTADGTAQPANQGAVTVAKGATIPFNSVVGLHTITENGTKQGDNLNQGQSRTLTFNDSGTFKITCDLHPDMKAYIFVQ